MQKITAYAAPLAMAIGITFVIPTPAFAKADARERVAECRANHDAYNLNMGQCVAGYEADYPAQTCILIRDFGALEFFGFKTVGDCINQLSGRG